MNRKEYFDKCFAPNWVEIDLDEVNRQQANKEALKPDSYELSNGPQYNKEERLESQRRKDLNTLLRELEDIRLGIEKAAEKQHRLANLMGFYTGELAG